MATAYQERRKDGAREPGERARPSAGTVLAVALVLGIVWLAVDVLLVLFAGILLAVIVRAATRLVSQATRLPEGRAFALTLLILLVLTATCMWFFSRSVSAQVERLSQELPQAIEAARRQLEQLGWRLQGLLSDSPSKPTLLPAREDLLSRTTGVVWGTLGALGTAVVILFVGIYVAAEPSLYRRGLIHLFPKRARSRADGILEEMGWTLQWWFLGKMLSMTLVGVLTTLGLFLLGIEAAIALGLLAAILTFVPNFGPVVSAIPAVLLGLAQGPLTALWVVLLYVAIQFVESYIVTPLIQERTVSMPPGLIISAQLLLGFAGGVMGLVLATPIAAIGIVLVKRVYVEDLLGDDLSDAEEDS